MPADDVKNLIGALHPHETRVLAAFGADAELSEAALYANSGLETAQARSAAERLKMKKILESRDEEIREAYRLTEVGVQMAKEGIPEKRILAHLIQQGPAGPQEIMQILGLSQENWGSAFGALKGMGAVETRDGTVASLAKEIPVRLEQLAAALQTLKDHEETVCDTFPPDVREELEKRCRKRGTGKTPIQKVQSASRLFAVTPLGRELIPLLQGRSDRTEISQLTPAMLMDGSWRKAAFRKYNLGLPPGRIVCGRKHPYRAFLDWARRKLVALGFEEMTGDLVQPEFWNSDALFMPQFHPAREIHDIYFVKEPAKGPAIEEPFLGRVAEAHERGAGGNSRGWGYRFDRERTLRLILRSQGTALSARRMSQKPQVPGKYFAIARCFRYDTVDATHAADFYQVEGFVTGEKINMRHLLGLLKLFAVEVARAQEVRFQPTYFPFTEPSVEVHIKHPKIGWMEMGGAGIFRPEVTLPLGLTTPTIAWGLGLDRMAMVALGISDIRDLFSPDLELLRRKSLKPLE